MGENKLGNESSPYLLQHAQNPVDWHAWNEEALGRDEDASVCLAKALKIDPLNVNALKMRDLGI